MLIDLNLVKVFSESLSKAFHNVPVLILNIKCTAISLKSSVVSTEGKCLNLHGTGLEWGCGLLEKTTDLLWITGENHWPVASHRHTLSHIVVSSTPRNEQDSNSQH